MGTNLKSTIDTLAQTFAAGILQAIRSAPLDEILGEGAGRGGRKPGRPAKATTAAESTGGGKRARGGRLARRTADDIQAVVESIVSLVKKSKGGLRAEQIRAQLNLDKREIGRPIAEALAKKKLTKKGEKRATTYFAK